MKQIRQFLQFRLIIFLIAFSIVLFACANKNDQVSPGVPVNTAPSLTIQAMGTPVTPFTDIGDGGFLSKEPCGPPCFMGITPGISKKADVLEFLQSKINLSSCERWDTTNTGGTKGIRCDKVGFTFQDTDIVNGIGFEPNKEISMKEVLAVYGNPDSLFVVWELDNMGKIQWVQMNLYYDNIYTGLVLARQDNSVYEITPETLITNISFEDHLNYEKSKVGTKPWEGFGEYPPSSVPLATPSIERTP